MGIQNLICVCGWQKLMVWASLAQYMAIGARGSTGVLSWWLQFSLAKLPPCNVCVTALLNGKNSHIHRLFCLSILMNIRCEYF